jgi:hypothetical protein
MAWLKASLSPPISAGAEGAVVFGGEGFAAFCAADFLAGTFFAGAFLAGAFLADVFLAGLGWADFRVAFAMADPQRTRETFYRNCFRKDFRADFRHAG